MPAVAGPVFRVAALQMEPGLLVTFLLQIMQQRRIGVGWQLSGQFVNARKELEQVRFGIGRGHGLDGGVQFVEGVEEAFSTGAGTKLKRQVRSQVGNQGFELFEMSAQIPRGDESFQTG